MSLDVTTLALAKSYADQHSGGGGQVQPDWNQNDETAADYVKNRPFYTGDPVETVIVEESTVSFAPVEGTYMGRLKSTFVPKVGETYKVYWDGTVYECTCGVLEDLEDFKVIGNLSIINGGSDTGEPFLIGINDGIDIEIGTLDASNSHTFSISGFAQEIVKIDPKYIRDMYYTGDPVETVLVEESTVTFAKNHGLYTGRFPSTFEAKAGETYKVYWDGTAYESTCVNFNGLLVIGNLSIIGEGSDTGEPFVIGVDNGVKIQITTADTSASHTVSISGFVQEVVKIDEKYLPLGNCIKTVNGTAPDASGNVEVQTISEDALSTNQYGTVIIVKNGIVFKNRLGQYTQTTIGESNAAILVKEGETSNAKDTTFAFVVAPDANNGISADQIRLSKNGIDFVSENVGIRSLNQAHQSVDVIQLNSSESHGVMVEITKKACFVLPSSTSGSTKKFRITVDDSGALTAKEITTK